MGTSVECGKRFLLRVVPFSRIVSCNWINGSELEEDVVPERWVIRELLKKAR